MFVTISIFIGIYVLGFLVAVFSAMTIGDAEPYDTTFYNMIIFSILYLSGIVASCTYLVLRKIKAISK